MRILSFFLLLFTLAYSAQQVEVTANRFEADREKLVTKFFGNVVFTRAKDMIRSQKAFIYFNKEKKPIKFHAIGDVKFDLTDKGKRYKGSCDELIYFPKKKEYILIGKVYVEQQPDNRKIFADKAIIDLISGTIEVEATGKKPVKLIFEVDEK